MCTVTFIPLNGTYFLTSNRDEKSGRITALPPEIYNGINNRKVYPKDADAGGTWIACKDNGSAAVLLNGAFTRHIPSPPYKRSRGLVFLEILDAEKPARHFMNISLEAIEPFTMIILDESLHECRWDGTEKHCNRLNKSISHIWSSATLYNDAAVEKRKQWFNAFMKEKPSPGLDDVLHFHQFTGDGDIANDLKMDRNGVLYTVSVTGIVIEPCSCKMRYLDLKHHTEYETTIERKPVIQEFGTL